MERHGGSGGNTFGDIGDMSHHDDTTETQMRDDPTTPIAYINAFNTRHIPYITEQTARHHQCCNRLDTRLYVNPTQPHRKPVNHQSKKSLPQIIYLGSDPDIVTVVIKM